MQLTQKQVQHLYLRAGFGLAPVELNDRLGKTSIELFNGIKKASDIINPLKADITWTKMVKTPDQMSQEEKLEKFKESKESIKNLNIAWIKKMAMDNTFLREKMTLFWHNHFACQERNPYLVVKQNNTIRENALGKFGDLLTAVSKDAAMLRFLNNQQNRKQSPNENFAREVMELFTMGRGNYTETDVKEGARAFTGWGFDITNGEFQFRSKFHDYDEKVFLGRKGNFDGDDILKILLEEKQTAKFVVQKIYKWFVNPDVDPEKVDQLAEYFYQHDHDISLLMEKIFTSDWFYEEKNIGSIVKSPVDLLVQLARAFKITYGNENFLVGAQRVLGQTLFYPPNVAGWPGGRSWIDSSTLLLRMKLPVIIFNKNLEEAFQVKDTGDDNDPFKIMKNNFLPQAEWDEERFLSHFSGKNNTPQNISDYLLQVPVDTALISMFINGSNQHEAIKSTALALMQLPEFQLS